MNRKLQKDIDISQLNFFFLVNLTTQLQQLIIIK